MPTNDPAALSKPVALPIEIWLDILSYLPRASRRKTIGISRLFFELVLDELYEEMRIVEDNQETLYRISQLQNGAIATRVQRLLICPKFLPGLEDHQNAVSKTTFQQRFRSVLISMKSGTPTVTAQITQGVVLLETVERNIKLCSNIHELKVVPQVQVFTPPFKSLLKSLCHSESIAPRLKTLILDSPPTKLAELLSLSLYRLSSFMTNLEHLDITLSIDLKKSGDRSLTTVPSLNFEPFFEVLKHQLTSLSTSGFLLPHLYDLYKNVPTFTRLRQLSFFVCANIRDLSPLDQVSRCIGSHADTLEHLVLKFRPEGLPGRSNRHLLHWLTLQEAADSQQPFSSLLLPRLQTLELDSLLYWDAQNYPILFPEFARVAPALRELTITGGELPFSRVCELVDQFPAYNGRCTLELLKLHADLLSPELMDLFAAKLPRLKFLELHLSVATDNMKYSSPNQFLFCETIRARNYPAWGLRYLRITSRSFCGEPHPNIFLMTTVAATLSSDITLGTGYRCDCGSSLNSSNTKPSRNFGDFFE